MDQLTAHLDHGWDLAQRGDFAGAQSSAERAIELEPESPEAYNLLGYAAALEGSIEEALEAYEQAVALDDTYVEAMLNAAELYLHPLGEYDEVLALCRQVLDITDYEDEILDARLLEFEALSAQGQTERAKQLLSRLPPGPYEHATHAFVVGRAFFEAGEIDRAGELLESAVELDPQHSDALYYAALVREERGDHPGATEAFLRSRELELAMGLPPWAPTGDALRVVTEAALGEVAAELRSHIRGADVFISGVPGAEVVVDGVDPRSLVLIDRLPDEPTDPRVRPGEVRIFIYALNLVKAAGVLEGLQAQIRDALEQEIRVVFLPPEGASAER
ncbi:MAG: tetratricopeptide repeat protein [Deltaproteobacteria bacterium]|jgi:tetratricopeptide (TPR) repeat protein|nr:tetratricopeptide repeat protein [Deltaproteobacteria bacterium]